MNSCTKFKIATLLPHWSQRVDRFKSTSNQDSNGALRGGSSKRADEIDTDSIEDLSMNCFASGTNAKYMEYLFSKWMHDKNSVHVSWQKYFGDILRKSNEEHSRAKAVPGSLSDLIKLEEDKKQH